MNDPIINRVSQLEIVQSTQGDEIHQINEKVGHIEKDMSDFKTISKTNATAIEKTNEKLTDIHFIMHEFKGGWRVVKIIATLLGSIIGISLTILTIIQIIKALNDGS